MSKTASTHAPKHFITIFDSFLNHPDTAMNIFNGHDYEHGIMSSYVATLHLYNCLNEFSYSFQHISVAVVRIYSSTI